MCSVFGIPYIELQGLVCSAAPHGQTVFQESPNREYNLTPGLGKQLRLNGTNPLTVFADTCKLCTNMFIL